MAAMTLTDEEFKHVKRLSAEQLNDNQIRVTIVDDEGNKKTDILSVEEYRKFNRFTYNDKFIEDCFS